jgi:hypothetical protein
MPHPAREAAMRSIGDYIDSFSQTVHGIGGAALAVAREPLQL